MKPKNLKEVDDEDDITLDKRIRNQLIPEQQINQDISHRKDLKTQIEPFLTLGQKIQLGKMKMTSFSSQEGQHEDLNKRQQSQRLSSSLQNVINIFLQQQQNLVSKEANTSTIIQNNPSQNPIQDNIQVPDYVKDNLQKKGYVLTQFIAKGGEAEVYEGRQIESNKLFAIKIYYDTLEVDFSNEINLIKSVKNPIHLVKFIDSIQLEKEQENVNEKNYIQIIIMERCVNSLFKEIQDKTLKEKDILKIVFDLIDGLIELRYYEILHLDIKPANILKTSEGNYVYSDFGISQRNKKNMIVEIKGKTLNYAPPEQIEESSTISFYSDTFALGKSLLKLFESFIKENQSNKHFNSIIEKCQQIVQEKMTQNEILEREDCLNLHKLIFEQFDLVQFKDFFSDYFNKIDRVINDYPFDDEKDIPNFSKVVLYYCKLQLTIAKKLDQIDNIYFSLQRVAKCYLLIGQYEQALKFSLQQLDLTDKEFSKFHFMRIECSNFIGVCYSKLSDLCISQKYAQEVYQYNYINGQNKTEQEARSLVNLAVTEIRNGQNQLGIEKLLNALNILKLYYKNHELTPNILSNLGTAYQNLGQYEKALEYGSKSLKIRKQLYKSNHPEVAISLNNVGLAYYYLGDYTKASEFINESYKMRKELYEHDTPQIAVSLKNIASIYLQQNNFLLALEYSLESLEIRKKLYPNRSHIDVAFSLKMVGLCYEKLGQYQNALIFCKQGLDMIKQLLQQNHPDIASTLDTIGQMYENLGEYEESLKYSLQSLEISQQILPSNHPHLVSLLNNVGIRYQNLEQHENALVTLKKSLEIAKQIYQENNSEIAITLSNIGQSQKELGQYGEALISLNKAIEIVNFNYKNQPHPLKVNMYLNLGSIYLKMGDYMIALNYSQLSKEQAEELFPKNHLVTAFVLLQIALIYKYQKMYQQSLKQYQEVLEMLKQLNLENHPQFKLTILQISQLKDIIQSQISDSSIFPINNIKDVNYLSERALSIFQKQNYKEAKVYFLQIIKLSKESSQPHSQFLSLQYLFLGICQFLLEEYQSALKSLLHYLENQEEEQEDMQFTQQCLYYIQKSYKQLGDYLMHVEYKLQYLEVKKKAENINYDSQYTRALFSGGQHYFNFKYYQRSLYYFLLCKETCQSLDQKDNKLVAAIFFNIGSCYKYLKDYQNALKYLKESLQMKKNIYNGNHIEIKNCLQNISYCYMLLEQFEDALSYSLQSLKMTKDLFDQNNDQTASAYQNLAICYQNIGDFQKYIINIQKYILIEKELPSPDSYMIANSQLGIGQTYYNLEDFVNAISFYQQSIQTFKSIYKEDHLDIARLLYKLGLCYERLNNNQEALNYYQKTLEMRRRIFKGNHKLVAVCTYQIALIYYKQKQSKKALEYILQYIEMRKQINLCQDPEMSAALDIAAQIYGDLGQTKKALSYALESLEIAKQVFKGDNRDIGGALNTIGMCYYKMGQYLKAKQYCIESLKMSQRLYKGYNSLIILQLTNVSAICMAMGEYKNGLKYLLEKLELILEFDKNNKSQLSCLFSEISECYFNLNDIKLTLFYSQESISINSTLF